MGLLNFNGVWGAKPRQFDYRPRYYDLEEEARRQRKREVLGEDFEDKYKSDEQRRADYKPGVYIRNAAMQRRGIERSPSALQRNTRNRAKRLGMIFVALVLLAAWLLSTNKLDVFFNTWLTK